ncbi:dihydrofolate reductase [Candidatus Parcubacteria bacterium]|jgi:dihydrofolate reductase|nr:dihydrofolate reductase [Candidatus Parcubacteria bacterium]MBT7228195.1 dihydrofolate reductase [Candidatus Parcubacteria bacterium]
MISIICAIAKDRGIGNKNKLLVHLPPDLKHFKNITSGHMVIMGQTTFESIGFPLPNRVNVIMTKDKDFEAKGCTIVYSMEEALEVAKNSGDDEAFFIGGASIYAQAIKYADKLYLTIMDKVWEADTFFPEYDEFNLASESEEQEYEGLKFKYTEFTK